MNDIMAQNWHDSQRFFKLTGVKEHVKNLEIIDGIFCFDINWLDEIYNKYKNQKINFFLSFIKRGCQHGEKIKKFVRNLNLNKDIKFLERDFWLSLELLNNLVVFLPVTHPLAKIVENKVRLILKSKKISDDKFEETLISLTQPRKLNSPILEQMDLQKIRANQHNPRFNLLLALKKHVDKYSFLGYREPFAPGFDIKFFKNRLKEEKFIKGSDKISIKLTAQELAWVNLMRDMVFFRNYRTEKMSEAFYYLEPLWDKIGRCYGLAKNELAHYQAKEIKDLFARRIKVNKSIINSREVAHGYLIHNDKVRLITGSELDKKNKKYNSVKGSVKEIKGSIACSGLVRGVAKVIMSSKDQNKLKTGEILVTSMTTPDFLPSMRRAAAFVTDEGGITCHAAIVAREMQKPCVIGTKNSTQIFKDGDLIEVDANRGIIKKLS